MPTLRFTEKTVAKLPAPTDCQQAYYWDDEITGFGMIVGRPGTKTFVVYGRLAGVKGKRVKQTIGVHGQPRDDRHVWSVELARAEAKIVLGKLAMGKLPKEPLAGSAGDAPDVELPHGMGELTIVKPYLSVAEPAGPTLRDGVAAHLAKMKKKHRSDRSIQTFKHETSKYLADWLDRPFAELTGARLSELHQQIKEQAARRTGTNPANDKGAPLANRVVAHVSASWRSLNRKLEGKLGNWNPAAAVDRDIIRPSRERVQDEDLPDYAARVASMRSPIRRDGLMFALYTGLRCEDVRTMRFERVDFDDATAHLSDPKGGPAAAFTIPLSKTALAILRRRQEENVRDFGREDGGWCFPGLNQKGEVGPISDLRQVDADDKRFPAEDVHSLRRTWESIANDEGISELDQHVLSNHSFGAHNVNATYISQHIGHLAKCADVIDTGITRRINATYPRKRKQHQLRAVA